MPFKTMTPTVMILFLANPGKALTNPTMEITKFIALPVNKSTYTYCLQSDGIFCALSANKILIPAAMKLL